MVIVMMVDGCGDGGGGGGGGDCDDGFWLC